MQSPGRGWHRRSCSRERGRAVGRGAAQARWRRLAIRMGGGISPAKSRASCRRGERLGGLGAAEGLPLLVPLAHRGAEGLRSPRGNVEDGLRAGRRSRRPSGRHWTAGHSALQPLASRPLNIFIQQPWRRLQAAARSRRRRRPPRAAFWSTTAPRAPWHASCAARAVSGVRGVGSVGKGLQPPRPCPKRVPPPPHAVAVEQQTPQDDGCIHCPTLRDSLQARRAPPCRQSPSPACCLPPAALHDRPDVAGRPAARCSHRC